MRKLLNTLYVSSQGTYVHREGETVVVELNGERAVQLPIHTLGGIVCFGNVLCSPAILGLCSERDVSVSFLTEYGRFLASVQGPVRGNVLLRRKQFRMADDKSAIRDVSANVVTGKLANSRTVLHRAMRDHRDKSNTERLRKGIATIDRYIDQTRESADAEQIRGYEGISAAAYFEVFDDLIVDQKDSFHFTERTRRPPRDEVNALLSFMYTLLAHDVRSALETVGLDPAVGFLHRDRPGRPGLALDLMEEFRPPLADRIVLSLINRRQISVSGFKQAANGSVVMDEETRRIVLVAYQNRKKDTVRHNYIDETVPIGLLFFVQANLMARYIRGDIDGYPPFFWR